jgi:flagellar P-ring protein precursor FlgI
VKTIACLALAAGLGAQQPMPVPVPVPIPIQGTAPVVQPPINGSSVTVNDPPAAAADALPLAGAPKVPVAIEPEIRNITRLHNSMPAQLVGIGLVSGLSASGSSDRGTRQALLNMIRRHNLNLTIADVAAGSTALVSLTATLPTFAKQGQKLDVKVEVLGDASSLRNGHLLMGEMRAITGDVYVTAQGPITVGGFAAAGPNAQVQKNSTTTGWVNGGGLVVRDLDSSFFSESGNLELQLINPSPFNAMSVAKGITSALDGVQAKVVSVDTTLVRIELPESMRTNETALRLIDLIGRVRVRVENPATVVIDQASGIVLAGEGVLISPCVVGLTDLTIAVVNDEEVSQPLAPFSQGSTERVSRTRIEVQTNNSQLKPVSGGVTVADLLQNLRTMGLTPAQLMQVFEKLHSGGYLQAELEVR